MSQIVKESKYEPKGTLIEETVIDWLNRYFAAEMPAVKAYNKEPVHNEPNRTRPARFVVVQLQGGGESNHISSALLTVQSYAPSSYEAAVLDSFVRDGMSRIVELDVISSCKLNSHYPYDREDKNQPRYQAVFDIVYYK